MKTALALGVLGAMALVGVSVGAIPGSDGTISACVQKPGLLNNPGEVRVIDKEAGQSCRNNESALSWQRTDAVHQARVAEDGTLLAGDATSASFISPVPAPGQPHYRMRFAADLTDACVATAVADGAPAAAMQTEIDPGSDSIAVRPEHAFSLIVAC